MKEGDLIYVIGPDGYDYKKAIISNVEINNVFNYLFDGLTKTGKDNLNGVFTPDLSMHSIFTNKHDLIEYYENKITKLNQERISIESLVVKINLDK